MRAPNLNITSRGRKDGRQEVQGCIVRKQGQEFEFNFATVRDPEPLDMELLKIFRNHFVGELEKLNENLARLTE